MTYTHCATCVSREDFDKLGAKDFIGPISLVIIGGLLAIASGALGALVLVLGAYWAWEKFCAWIRGGKLICIAADQCVIGRVVELEEVGYDKNSYEKIDNDYCVDLLLAPHDIYASHKIIENDTSQGKYIKQHETTKDLGWGEYHTNKPPEGIPVLHCEFEGMRICDFCNAVRAAHLMAMFAISTCIVSFFIPIIGWIICVAVAMVAATIMTAMLLIGWFGAHDGDPNDAAVNPGDGTLTAISPDGTGGDYVVISGDWVYDAGHSGYNEIHPAKSVQKIHGAPTWKEGNHPAEVEAFRLTVLNRWCNANGVANAATTHDAQKKQQNRWCIHPELDGCKSGNIPR